MLLFLHGYDEAAPLEIHRGLMRHGPLRAGNPPTSLRDFIVVAPQLPAPGDTWRSFAPEVGEILRGVQARHGGDPRRSYLTGFSFGGNGVFDLALEQPDLWAALWAVDPTRVPGRDPGKPVWISSGEVSRRGRAAFIQRLRLEPLGDAPPGERVYLDRGLDHVGTAASAYGEERVYSWLLSRRPLVRP